MQNQALKNDLDAHKEELGNREGDYDSLIE